MITQTLSAYVQPRLQEVHTDSNAPEQPAEHGGEALDPEPFFEWVAAECYLSPRVSGSVRQLWTAYAAFTKKRGIIPERFAFVKAMAAAFLVRSGMAGGVCLARERDSYLNAKPVGVPHRAFRKESLRFPMAKPAAPENAQQAA